jgi:hypothetical protein
MPLQETSGAASFDAFGGGAAAVPVYIEDVFSTYLYSGNDTNRTITNGIDLDGEGGLVWVKERTSSSDHILADTLRGAGVYLRTNSDSDNVSGPTTVTGFNSDGFDVGVSGAINESGQTYVSWSFRKQPKFFDCITYTGTGANRTVSHNLGSVPGCIIVKRYDADGYAWQVYHRSLANTEYMVLNSTANVATGTTRWNSTTPTSTVFSLGTDSTVNASGGSYVAYLFAHDAGGFGAAGTDNVISCGSYTGTGATQTVELGYEPQYILFRRSDTTSNWRIFDVMRGMSQTDSNFVSANLSNAETSSSGVIPTATGFTLSNATFYASGGTYIYIAIRRGPMKTPTSGTSVFSPVASSAQTGTITSGFPTDLVMSLDRVNTPAYTGFLRMFQDRLRGSFRILNSELTAAETSNTSTASFDSNTGVILNGGSVYLDGYVHEQFRRAPGFFDVVCYTGTGADQTIAHNLGAVPELIIVKSRSNASTDWLVKPETNSAKYLYLNQTDAIAGPSTVIWSSSNQTASNFYVGVAAATGASGYTYVAYLFASVAGVSKVGSYTGTGTTQVINCGFTAGSRFVMIKRTDSTGDWYVWDSARGIVAGNDPYLLMNSTAAEVTNTDYVDTANSGFEISSTAPAAINANGGSFIFFAVA